MILNYCFTLLQYLKFSAFMNKVCKINYKEGFVKLIIIFLASILDKILAFSSRNSNITIFYHKHQLTMCSSCCEIIFTEAAVCRCSTKYFFVHISRNSLAQLVYYNFCKTFKITFFIKYLRATASQQWFSA